MGHRITPCVGRHQLFDSSDIEDHLHAKALCAVCPLQLPCATRLIEVRAAATESGQPVGTWAGQLVSRKRGRPRSA